MRTDEQLAADNARVQRAVVIEERLERLMRRYHARSPEDLVRWLDGPDGEMLRELLDEVREWSRESRSVEVTR